MNKLNTLTPAHRSFKPSPFVGLPTAPTGGNDSRRLHEATIEALSRIATSPEFANTLSAAQKAALPLQEQLYNARAACKIRTATVAMHLTADWRTRFFSQLDSLLDIESWDPKDVPATEGSFGTLLRMILHIRAERRPGLGATGAGNFIAAWTEAKDRLTIECKPDDQVRWVLVHDLAGQRESAAGETTLPRLLEVLSPYDPQRWFKHAADQAPS